MGLVLNITMAREALPRLLAAVVPGSATPGIDRFFNVTLQSPEGWAYKLALTVGATLPTAFVVLWLTPPTEKEHLYAFCRKVRPYGPGWAKVRREMGKDAREPDTRFDWRMLLSGAVLFYATWASLGLLWTGHWVGSAIAGCVLVISGTYLLKKWKAMPDGPE